MNTLAHFYLEDAFPVFLELLGHPLDPDGALNIEAELCNFSFQSWISDDHSLPKNIALGKTLKS
jgi:hypothetical protein